jgi:hypothetical protein
MTIENMLDPQFSHPGARPTPWEEARAALEAARTYCLTSV